MRITGRQLRRIIQEEVERMMNEEAPAAEETFVVGPDGKVIDPDRDKKFYSDFAMMLRAKSGYGITEQQVIKSPSLADVRDTGPWNRVFDRLLAGEVFSDRNADADAKMVINTLIERTIAANEPLRGRFQPSLPNSPFGSNLKVLQRILRIDADGILGLQTYFAILTGGLIDLPSDTLRKYSNVLKEIQKRIKSREAMSKLINDIIADAMASSAKSGKLSPVDPSYFETPPPRALKDPGLAPYQPSTSVSGQPFPAGTLPSPFGTKK